MMNNPSHRQAGVRAADGPREYGDPRSVLSLVRLDMYGIQFRDSEGLLHKSVVMVGEDGSVYVPKNGEAWASELQASADWLKKGVTDKLTRKEIARTASVELPKTDTVDVLGGSEPEPDAAPAR